MNVAIVLTTLILYKLVLLGIGFWAEKRTKTQADFILGGRGLGPIVGAISYSASAASAWTLLGMSGAAYLLGFSAIWVAGGAVLGSVIAWGWIAPRMMRYSRDHNLMTLTEFLAHGEAGRLRTAIIRVASVIIFFSFLFYIASQFQGAASSFTLAFGMGGTEAIILGATVILIYTMLGGFWAVSVTDTLQGILMLGTAIVLPIVAFIAVAGMGDLWTSLDSVFDPAALTLSGHNTGLAVMGFAAGSLAIGLGAIGQPHLLARFMAIRDKHSMAQARVIGVVWYATVFIGMFIVGLMGRVLVPALDNHEDIFFTLIVELFDPVTASIMLAAVLSAVMSTADSMLLVTASTVSYDLGAAKKFPGRELLISRLAIVAITVGSVAIATMIPASIFARVLFAWNALGAAFGPLIIMRLAGVRVGHSAALAAICVGFGLAVVFSLMPNTPGDVLERILPFIVGLGILWVGRSQKES